MNITPRRFEEMIRIEELARISDEEIKVAKVYLFDINQRFIAGLYCVFTPTERSRIGFLESMGMEALPKPEIKGKFDDNTIKEMMRDFFHTVMLEII